MACGGEVPSLEVPFEELIPKAFRAIPKGNYVLRSSAEWSALWLSSPAQFLGDPFPQADKSTPVFDFQSSMLLVLSLGTGVRCNLPQVTRIADQGSVRGVQWKTNEDTGITTSACNYLYPLITLVSAPASDRTVEFLRLS